MLCIYGVIPHEQPGNLVATAAVAAAQYLIEISVRIKLCFVPNDNNQTQAFSVGAE